MPLNSRAGRASWRSVSPTTISRSCGTSPVPLPAFDSYRGARRPLARSSQRPPHQAEWTHCENSASLGAPNAFSFSACARYEPTGACVAGDGDGHAQSTVRSVNVGSYPGSARLVAAQRIGEECQSRPKCVASKGLWLKRDPSLHETDKWSCVQQHRTGGLKTRHH